MAWPQIGSYTEDGKTIRVFKAGYAGIAEEIYTLYPKKIYSRWKTKEEHIRAHQDQYAQELNF